MAGMGSMIAITEMHRRTEEMILRVRSELFRAGSSPDNFSVERQGLFLQMTYCKQTICTDPYEVWVVLRKMSSGLDDKEIWAQLSSVRQVQMPSARKLEWGVGLLLAGFILALFLFNGSIF